MGAPSYFDLDVARQIGATFTGNTTWTDNSSAIFGTGSDSSIFYDGTNLIIEPRLVGSGIVKIGAQDTDIRSLHVYRIGIGDAVVSAGALLQGTTSSSTISGVFSATLTHTGPTNTMRTMLFTSVHQGTATGNHTSIGSVFTGNIDSDASTATRSGIGTQGACGFSSGRVQTQGTADFSSVIAKTVSSDSTHTGGTIRARNLLVEAEKTFAVAGATVAISVAAQFQGTVHIFSDKKLILEGTAFSAGDSYFIFNSATTDIDCFVDNTKTQTWDNDAIDYFVLQRQGDNLETRFGTGEDVSIGYTGTVWDFNILQATTEVVFNNAGIDTDFRIESDTDADMLFVNAGTNRVGISTNAPTKTLGVDGDLALETAGNGHYIKEGTNATMGSATLVAGTVVVSTTKVTASSRIFLQGQNTSGTAGELTISARTAGTSFTITSLNVLDTRLVAWIIMEPA